MLRPLLLALLFVAAPAAAKSPNASLDELLAGLGRARADAGL